MRSQQLFNTLLDLYKIRRTVCIEGPPGGGKTSIVHQVAKHLGVDCVELHMPTMLVEDFGILFPEGDELNYKLPAWFPVEGKAAEEGILLFDDRNQASSDLQKVLANICQSRTLHGHKLPKGWQVISTGNRQSDRAGANKVLSHLRNRETVIEFETTVEDWSKWALSNGVSPVAVSFFGWRPSLLNMFDPTKDLNATPRSWSEGVFDLMGHIHSTSEYECYKGAVGEGPAAEFMGYLKIYRGLPDMDMVLKNPSTANVPTDPSTMYAVCGALAERVAYNTMNQFMEYMNRFPTEFAMLAITMVADKVQGARSHPAYTKWAHTNAHMFG